MQPISGDDITAALQLLADAVVEREQEISKYSDEAENSDKYEDNDSDAPIFDQFYDRGVPRSPRSRAVVHQTAGRNRLLRFVTRIVYTLVGYVE